MDKKRVLEAVKVIALREGIKQTDIALQLNKHRHYFTQLRTRSKVNEDVVEMLIFRYKLNRKYFQNDNEPLFETGKKMQPLNGVSKVSKSKPKR